MLVDFLRGFDFSQLRDANFKEDSVREEIIMPILHALGWGIEKEKRIVRSKKLQNPLMQVRSIRREVHVFPDYLLEEQGQTIFVLDAKAPNQDVEQGKNVEQVYYYAMHPEIKSRYFGLCNGFLFTMFEFSKETPIVRLDLTNPRQVDIDNLILIINGQLTPNLKLASVSHPSNFDYATCKIPQPLGKIQKQATRRHYGVHGYFTRQSWDVLQSHINAFTNPGDTVLDPFGGGGVTAIEAFVLGRKAIHVDLNPISSFWVESLLMSVESKELEKAKIDILAQFDKQRPKNASEVKKLLEKLPLPKNEPINSTGSDFHNLYELFTDIQLAELALLKSIILQQKKEGIRRSCLLAFSSSLTKHNLTYHPSKSRTPNAGDSAVFRYSRYRKAKNPVSLDLSKTYGHKLSRLIKAKEEIYMERNQRYAYSILRGDATKLEGIPDESVDFIYTDPPYGAKIAYLDLSTMFNAWLDLEVTQQDKENEVIEKGSLDKSFEEYKNLLTRSVEAMFRVLKWDRWVAFVFQHEKPKYWSTIVDTFKSVGFEYVASRKESVSQTSFKKRQGHMVLSGQLILYFRKVKSPLSLLKANIGASLSDLVFNHIESMIAQNKGATIEGINDFIVQDGLENGYLDLLEKEFPDLDAVLHKHYEYDATSKKFTLKAKTKFKTHIPLTKRIEYYLSSYLIRENRQENYPSFDQIVLDIMPLLQNGTIPDEQDILLTLNKIATKGERGYHFSQNRLLPL
ncbi:DNA methyltransferase [Entomospira culicis]|uniref:DNA methylase n=1 Tax=Entomospira culicis TaxID=2719989 RepID=A0A968GES0_9SPIO|nr:DNA methyltransferase [Entomospira culicis]NIZ18707.1 DNA methylase [Entomospira culicis]NIZ68922.1 DNA methylase [Entomospira culicis]WDI37515.1 DNA methyltransferase [Entomospira culicis]WDI39143.1 DNA methyltransferase [Entomospira culicis]